MKVMGLDIGGANTDYTLIEIDKNNVKIIKQGKKYLKMWKDNDKLIKHLLDFKGDEKLDAIVVTMTAELSDAYENKTEGVLDISQKVTEAYPNTPTYFVSFDGLISYDEVLENPLRVAAANWICTTNIIKYIKKDCIFMDMGTTTTDIIPIKNGYEIASGHSDFERLTTGELVYTGMLRTNLASIVHEIPINDKITSVSSELFTITADIYSILGFITEENYTCDTPDNKGKDIVSCKRRLCRLFCADLEEFTDDEIYKIAKYIYEKQIKQITNGLKKVCDTTKIDTVVTSSYGNSNTCYKSAKRLGLKIIKMEDYFSKTTCDIIPTLGAIQMYIDLIYPNHNIILPELI